MENSSNFQLFPSKRNPYTVKTSRNFPANSFVAYQRNCIPNDNIQLITLSSMKIFPQKIPKNFYYSNIPNKHHPESLVNTPPRWTPLKKRLLVYRNKPQRQVFLNTTPKNINLSPYNNCNINTCHIPFKVNDSKQYFNGSIKTFSNNIINNSSNNIYSKKTNFFKFRMVQSLINKFRIQKYFVYCKKNNNQKFAAKATKSQDTRLQNTSQGSVISHSTGISAMGAVPFYSPTQKTSTLFGNGKDEKKNKKKEKGRKICKEDISFPSNFQRIAHIGFDQHSGFQHTVSDSSAIDDSVKDVIKAAGFNPDNMNHDEIKFAKEFVSNYDPFDPNKYKNSSNDPFNAWGDVPSINRYSPSQTNYHESSYNPLVTHKKNMAPIPAYNAKSNTPNYYNSNQYQHNIQTPQPVKGKYYNDYNNSTQRTTPAPPPPIRKDINNYQNEISGKVTNSDMIPIRTAPTAPKRPTNMPPPPPPPVKSNRPPPPPPVLQSLNPISTKQSPAQTIPSSTGSCAPPPPPLPPPGLLKNPTSPQKPQPSTNNGRGDLLAEIQNGKTLRKVEQNSSEGGKINNTRDDLLAQIQRGTNLRHVESSDNEVQNRKSSTNIYQAEGIAGALARALEERRKNMVASDSEDSVSDNDEWDSD
uniref:WASp (inferred by orthology to a D. melanogaster protein) n=1 Tax=Strongyloides venezuelensis TaxID=75913 RepID=A0A0K0EWQ7_STRVS